MILEMLFDNNLGLARILVVGPLAYLSLVCLLRVSGKRTLSKMNAFDLIVTVALGSTLATALLSEQVALVEGLLGFCVLIGLQYLITWLSVRSKRVAQLIKSEPRLLVLRGEMLHGAMREERVIESEIRQAMRKAGLSSLDSVEAMVLETDGSFSIVKNPLVGDGPSSSLAGVVGSVERRPEIAQKSE